MSADTQNTVVGQDSGAGWAWAGFLLALLGIFSGGPAALHLIVGLLAMILGGIGLRLAFKTRRRFFEKFFAIMPILLGGLVVLAGIDGMGPNRMMTRARKVTSQANADALESAVNSIYAEYGKLPDVGDRVTTDSPEGVRLLNILLGTETNSEKAINPRAIKFLVVKEGKNRKNGLIHSSDGKTIEGLYDPWGSPYTVILDTEHIAQVQAGFSRR